MVSSTWNLEPGCFRFCVCVFFIFVNFVSSARSKDLILFLISLKTKRFVLSWNLTRGHSNVWDVIVGILFIWIYVHSIWNFFNNFRLKSVFIFFCCCCCCFLNISLSKLRPLLYNVYLLFVRFVFENESKIYRFLVLSSFFFGLLIFFGPNISFFFLFYFVHLENK